MKVLLISGSVSGEKRYGKLKSVGSYMPPYGLLSIAGLLEKDGHTVQILDREIHSYANEEMARKIEQTRPDLIGMSVFTIGFKEAIRTATFLKQHFDIPIVAGGPHTFVDLDNFSRNECFDFFVIGEGEITMSELVKTLVTKGDLGTVAGLATRIDRKFIENSPRERLNDLDILPFPAFHLLENIKAYHPSPLGYRKRPFFPLVTSRGCPFHCYFCSAIWGHKWVAHSADYVVNLIEYLIKEFNAKEIWFSEDTFVIDKQRVVDICQGILKRNLKISWTCMGNVHKLDREMLSVMKESGCWQIQLGLESGNDEVLKFVGKKTSVYLIREKLNLIHEVGIQPRGYFILDHLIETKETMQQTIDFAMSLPLYSADFHLLQLPFGSRAREIAHKYGKVDYNPDLLTGYSSRGLGFVPKGMTESFLFRTQRKAHLRFFLRPRQILQMITSIRTPEDIHRYLQMFWAGVKTLL